MVAQVKGQRAKAKGEIYQMPCEGYGAGEGKAPPVANAAANCRRRFCSFQGFVQAYGV